MVAMAETIESEVRNAMTEVGERTTAMAQAVSHMSGSAIRTGTSAEGAAAAAAQALANAQTIASAAEELRTRSGKSAVRGTSRPASSRALSLLAVQPGNIGALNEQEDSTGSVADMIGGILAKLSASCLAKNTDVSTLCTDIVVRVAIRA